MASVIDSKPLNNNLSNNAFSDPEKLTFVRPIHKKTTETKKIYIYRPVSILNYFSKIYEKFLGRQPLPFVNRSLSELISTYGSGYSTNYVSIRFIGN